MELCPGGDERQFTKTPEEYNYGDYLLGIRPKGVKRIRMKCPACGRKLWSSIKFTHDADDVMHTIPPHKPKMWWKKNKKRKIRR